MCLCSIGEMQVVERLTLVSIFLLCASSCWAEAIPSGALADHHLHCSWIVTKSESDCDALLSGLETIEFKNKEAKLALLRSRRSMAAFRGKEFPKDEYCAGVQSIVKDHPDFVEALYSLALCSDELKTKIAILREGLEIEPENYHALHLLLLFVSRAGTSGNHSQGVDVATLADYREAFYNSAKKRVMWELSVVPDNSGASDLIWSRLFSAARHIYDAALAAGDKQAATTLQNRIRKNARLDEVNIGLETLCRDELKDCLREDWQEHLALTCHPHLIHIALYDVCMSTVEELATAAASAGLSVPDRILKQVESTVNQMRDLACGKTLIIGHDCQGWEATETVAVARFRALLKDYGGEWSSEHHRVYSQAFLGDDERLDGLRTAIRLNAKNALARCDLARALAARGQSAEARTVLGDGDPECLENLSRGFTWVDWNDFLNWQERERESRRKPEEAIP